ncbi:vacuolar ATPase assembly integral membrane protein vma21-like [Pollicipes pollicipes]|uniref:vacuolar ATPase assembly integral membrane protein vma21-like n=1 Tax=Pollicipes pollicipes TaxID=41117 RepID=UPI00188524A6|nr:vacuolar ATPase assembly integral membrane protein vma21-like [Pollicipes pollicipes]XP_037085444.1 vacuolar ATPase assembly integral membrane protein vma21-like [Pollicipes pollicipes]
MDHKQEGTMSEGAIFRTAFFYVFLILFVPVAAFFASRTVLFEAMLGLDTSTSTLYAAVVTVIVIHAVLGLYVTRAFSEAEKVGKKD